MIGSYKVRLRSELSIIPFPSRHQAGPFYDLMTTCYRFLHSQPHSVWCLVIASKMDILPAVLLVRRARPRCRPDHPLVTQDSLSDKYPQRTCRRPRAQRIRQSGWLLPRRVLSTVSR